MDKNWTRYYTKYENAGEVMHFLPPGAVITFVQGNYSTLRNGPESAEVLFATTTASQIPWTYEEGEAYAINPVENLGTSSTSPVNALPNTANLSTNGQALVSVVEEARSNRVDACAIVIESDTALQRVFSLKKIPYLVMRSSTSMDDSY